MTLNEALGWQKTLKARHGELVGLRNQNAVRRTVRYGNTEPIETETPLYDIKHLDRQIAGVAKELRLLDTAIKATNAITRVRNYEQNEAAFGDLEAPAPVV